LVPSDPPSGGAALETRPRYTPTTCFETFPFPRPTDEQRESIAAAPGRGPSSMPARPVARLAGRDQRWRADRPDDRRARPH